MERMMVEHSLVDLMRHNLRTPGVISQILGPKLISPYVVGTFVSVYKRNFW